MLTEDKKLTLRSAAAQMFVAVPPRMLGIIKECGIFVLVGDTESRVLSELKNFQVITNMRTGYHEHTNKKAKKKDDEAVTCKMLGNLKNKYYQAWYNIYKMDKFPVALNWLGKEDRKEPIRSVAFVLPPDYSQSISLEELYTCLNKIPDADKILIVDQIVESDNLPAWCAKNGFELIEMNPSEEGKGDYEAHRENYGAKRLDEVLQTSDWPNTIKLEKKKSSEKVEAREEQKEHEFKPIQTEKEEGNGEQAGELDDADEFVKFMLSEIPMPRETKCRAIDPAISEVLKHELELVRDDVYSLRNAVNKLHDDVHCLTDIRMPPGSGVVTSTAEIENSTVVVFSTANETRTSSYSQSQRESSSYSETKGNDSFLINNGNQVAQASILITESSGVKRQKASQATRIFMEVDTSTSTGPPDILDMVSLSPEDIIKWQEAQADAEERTKPLTRHEYFAKLEKDYERSESSGVSGVISAVNDDAGATLDFSTYLGSVDQVRDALQGQQRQQRADTAGAVAAAIFNSMTVATEETDNGENGDSTKAPVIESSPSE
ncbi:hypothetical protein QR680_010371 [Steinernema hermaphroditum]|uniref:Uncharacterized protein n=1 Tax=Steinernema hermaphroditum TaxID=289476 RepID=A0AA39IQK5_9BILA|nr:hypothetical protein QR680_010371 [Steinernema hermaphroditum]